MRFPCDLNGNTEQMTDSGSDAFEKLVALLNYPMFVITTAAGGVTAGCLVGFASQTSIHPPRFLVGLSKRNHTFRVAAEATHLAVHVFDREHLDVVELFGERTGDTLNKFDLPLAPRSGSDTHSRRCGRLVCRQDRGPVHPR